MRIAMIGTRGVPARYGGFETAIEEIGQRLAAFGHEVVVYCRGAEEEIPVYKGMQLVHLPAAQKKSLETLSHTALTMGHLTRRARGDARPDVAIVFNAANSPFVPMLRARKIPFAVHVDGIEWRRAKWKGAGRRWYRSAESLAVRWADALIADAQGIADYYTEEFGATTELLVYGAPIQEAPTAEKIEPLGLQPHGYHLVVARFEPENHVLEIVRGYAASNARLPLIVVGSAPYADDYTAQIQSVADGDDRITMLGGVWDQDQLDQLYANALTYLHGHSVGGTNPSLLRAMGAGTSTIAFDVNFNREVLGTDGRFFADAGEAGTRVEQAEAETTEVIARGAALRDRARTSYQWDDVARGYEALLERLVSGYSRCGEASGRRRTGG